MAKNFRTDTDAFLTNNETSAPDLHGIEIPEGYRLVPAPRPLRFQVMLTSEVKQHLKMAAAAEGTSMNEIINRALVEYFKNHGL